MGEIYLALLPGDFLKGSYRRGEGGEDKCDFFSGAWNGRHPIKRTKRESASRFSEIPTHTCTGGLSLIRRVNGSASESFTISI
jgi:hypothetical protein